MSHFGANIPKDNMMDDAKNGRFESVSDFEKEFEEMIIYLNKAKEWTIEAIKKNQSCEHIEYRKPTYQLQRRAVCWRYVYKRVCVECGLEDTHECEEEDQKPEWAEGAHEMYYNNY